MKPMQQMTFVTALVGGGSIMVVEILGAKMLAPYFGTSHFVWTAQISVTLVALALGYGLGGRLSASGQARRHLASAYLLAGAYLALGVFSMRWIAPLFFSIDLGIAAFITSALLYMVPLTALATTGPILLQDLTGNAKDAGQNAGRLSAVSTVGSFLGTLLIGYLIIPYFRNSMTMYSVSALLVVTAILDRWAAVGGRKSAGPAVVQAGGAALLLIGILMATAGSTIRRTDRYHVVHERNSNFGELAVLENGAGSQRMLLNDLLLQNEEDPRSGQSLAPYTEVLHQMVRAFAPGAQSALVIGLGSGVVPTQLKRDGLEVDVVEINPAMVDVAEKYFGFDPTGMRLHVMDGRAFLNGARRKYDVIVLDAFSGDGTPVHLLSSDFFLELKERLSDRGALCINSFGGDDGRNSELSRMIAGSLQAAFSSIVASSSVGNVYFAASSRHLESGTATWDVSAVHPMIRDEVTRTLTGISEIQGDPAWAVTDDHNPVEFLDAKNKESFRKAAAAYWLGS